MNYLSPLLLGIVQGMTEFLPVSSSGHLVITRYLLPGFVSPGVLFEVVLHAGTLLSILFYFRKRLVDLSKKYFWFLVIGTIPTGLMGVIFQDHIESLFDSTFYVGIALLFTGAVNYFTNRKVVTGKTELDVKKSFLVGIAQSIAIIPGVSRSGMTIFAGSYLNIDKKRAAEFSFLLSIPAVLGANLLEILKYKSLAGVSVSVFTIGFFAAFISGMIAISFLMKFLTSRKYIVFSYYCFFVGLLVLLLAA